MKKKDIPCVHWNECGGCPLITYPYAEQLKHKQNKVFQAFKNVGFDEAQIRSLLKPTRASPLTLGYRNKAKWILQKGAQDTLKMGIYSPGTHEVVDIPHCSVHAPAINEVSLFVKQELIKAKVPCGPLRDHHPILRYLIVRYSFREKKLIVVFITSVAKVPGLERVVREVEQKFQNKVVSIIQNINDDSGNALLGEANRFLKKDGELTESMGSLRVPVGPLSFLQVNSIQAAYLYKRVRELIGKGPFATGLDLYSGVGLIAMTLAPVTKKILAVEEVGPAALESITASRRNKLHNILQLCGDAVEGITTFLSEWGIPDWVVLNPPRKGCDEKVLAALVQRPPRKLVYVSCNPATLARDISMLLNGHPNFAVKTIEPVDMFPQTEHVECIVLLENKNFKNVSKKASRNSPSTGKVFTPKSRSLH